MNDESTPGPGPGPGPGSGTWTPRPDPTLLTTAQLNREISTARTEFTYALNGLSDLLTEKLASVKTQFELMEQQRAEQKLDTKAAVDAALSSSDKAIREQTLATEAALRKFTQLVDEKFASVKTQFELIEKQRVEQKADTKAAVDAALTAQKEAVKEQTTASDRSIAKSETATLKQLEQMNVTFTGPLSDLKDRVTALEAVRLGGKESYASVIALVGVLVAVSLLALGAMTFIGR